jgi:hypothetical protein
MARSVSAGICAFFTLFAENHQYGQHVRVTGQIWGQLWYQIWGQIRRMARRRQDTATA